MVIRGKSYLPARKRHLSDHGLRFIMEREGCVLHPYNDSAGHATIGVGHLIHLGPVTARDRWRYRHFTAADAKRLFQSDLKKYADTVRAVVRVRVTQNEFDAMVSLCFNIGRGGFATSSVVRYLNRWQRRKAADAFLMWVHPPVLRGRRLLEIALFRS